MVDYRVFLARTVPASAVTVGSPPRCQESPAPMCPRCGFRGDRHPTAGDCIDALREHIALLQFRLERRAQGAPSVHVGPRKRKDNRYVLLDGESLCLTEAARRLGLSTAALHFRLVARTGTREYAGIDVRAIGADVPRTPAEITTAANAAKAKLRVPRHYVPPANGAGDAADVPA